MFNLRQVVVTGVGCISPLGHDVKSTWDGLLAGRSGISEISRFDASGIASQIAGQADSFDPVTRLGCERRTPDGPVYPVGPLRRAGGLRR